MHVYRTIVRDRWRGRELLKVLAGNKPQPEPDWGLDQSEKAAKLESHKRFKERIGPLDNLPPLSIPTKTRRIL